MLFRSHIWLSRKLAHENHYPAIDVLGSVSRLASTVASSEHQAAAARLREALATFRASEDLVSIGAYAAGTNPTLDSALTIMPDVNAFLRQTPHEPAPFDESLERLLNLFPAEMTHAHV